MALNNYHLKRAFKTGEIVYIPTLGSELPLENGTATQFTICSIIEGNTDRSTQLIVTCQHGNETLKLVTLASKAYKCIPDIHCSHCGHEICYESDKELLKEYDYYCPQCDENLYGVEVNYK